MYMVDQASVIINEMMEREKICGKSGDSKHFHDPPISSLTTKFCPPKFRARFKSPARKVSLLPLLPNNVEKETL
jgi:hypothetical protein